MEEKILQLVSSQGIWATLSIILISYILKTQEKRDKKQYEREIEYQKIISELTEAIEKNK